MKELEVRTQMNSSQELTPIESELTGGLNPSTLDVRGNIFMPDGLGGTEQAPKNNTEINIPPKPDKIAEASVKEQVSLTTTPKEARRLWEKYSGTSLDDIKDPDERRTIELAIEKGMTPKLAGGADRSGQNEAPEIRTGKATWHSQGGDREIEVRSYMGKGLDGRDFVVIEDPNGLTFRVPIDEIEYPLELKPDASDGGSSGKPPDSSETATAGGEESAPKRKPREVPEEELEFISDVNELFSQEDVRNELVLERPDFEKIPQLEALINKYLDPADTSGKIGRFAQHILSENGISKVSKEVIMERLFEQILSMADETPDSPYGTYSNNLYVSTNLQTLLQLARTNMPDRFAYFGKLANVREVAHELNRNLRYGENYKKYVTESLRTSGLSFMHNDITGVRAVIREYERVSTHKVRQTKEWFQDEEIKAIDEEVKEILTKSAENIKTEGGRPLTKWEIDRALVVGKVLFAGTQRMAMYSAVGDLPHNALTTGRIGSRPFEYIARALYPFKMIAPRFFSSAGGSRRLMQRAFREQKDQLVKEGINVYPLLGLDERTILMDSLGAPDSQTHGWRAELMFFGSMRWNEDGERISMLDYINKHAKVHGGIPDDPIMGGEFIPKENQPKFSSAVKEAVLGQRLYLSILVKNGNFDPSLKRDIWKKISLLTPSTISSIAPDVFDYEGGEKISKDRRENIRETNKKTWEEMRHKIYAAENRRIDKDALLGKDYERSGEDLRSEYNAFLEATRIAEKHVWSDEDYTSILEYMGMSDIELDANEKKLLEKIIRRGMADSEKIANAKIPFTFAIIDAPEAAWDKSRGGSGGLEDEDLLRMLLSDQQHLSEGWGEINALIENPTVGLAEHMSKAVEGMGNVIGRHDAQKLVSPFILAYIKMASTLPLSEFIGGLQKMMRQPTSEMERYFRNSHISWDAQDRSDVLEMLSQKGAISDDISKGGLSDLDEAKKKTKSNPTAVMLRMVKLIMLLLGPEAGLALAKALLPPEVVNTLQKK